MSGFAPGSARSAGIGGSACPLSGRLGRRKGWRQPLGGRASYQAPTCRRTVGRSRRSSIRCDAAVGPGVPVGDAVGSETRSSRCGRSDLGVDECRAATGFDGARRDVVGRHRHSRQDLHRQPAAHLRDAVPLLLPLHRPAQQAADGAAVQDLVRPRTARQLGRPRPAGQRHEQRRRHRFHVRHGDKLGGSRGARRVGPRLRLSAQRVGCRCASVQVRRPVRQARESCGFSGDGAQGRGPGLFHPVLPTITSGTAGRRSFTPAIAAEITTTLRVGTLVYAADYRHPAVLAKDFATLDLLAEGRTEFGIGAGWLTDDYTQSGIELERPGVRIDRMIEALEVITGCGAGEPFDYDGSITRSPAWSGGRCLTRPAGRRSSSEAAASGC